MERYEIKTKIGKGGFGSVYEAYDSVLKRSVAIKRLLSLEDGGDLLKEAAALCNFQHPNIVTVFDVGEDSDGAFIVMELLRGETIRNLVKRAALETGDFLKVAEQCLDALIAAGQVNLLHRDLKPANIMIEWLANDRFQVKILDFGLAKISSAPSQQTLAQGDSVLGSSYFMAPEQFERGLLDARTDLYSLGCVLFYTLAGVYPFNGDTVMDVILAHLDGNPSPLSEIRKDLPEPLSAWVMQLMSRQPDDRPDSAKAALESLIVLKKSLATADQSGEIRAPMSMASFPDAMGSTHVTGPTGLVTGPTGLVTGRTRLVTGPTGPVTGRTMLVTGPTGLVTGPTGPVTGPTGLQPNLVTDTQPTIGNTTQAEKHIGWLVYGLPLISIFVVAAGGVVLLKGKKADLEESGPPSVVMEASSVVTASSQKSIFVEARFPRNMESEWQIMQRFGSAFAFPSKDGTTDCMFQKLAGKLKQTGRDHGYAIQKNGMPTLGCIALNKEAGIVKGNFRITTFSRIERKRKKQERCLVFGYQSPSQFFWVELNPEGRVDCWMLRGEILNKLASYPCSFKSRKARLVVDVRESTRKVTVTVDGQRLGTFKTPLKSISNGQVGFGSHNNPWTLLEFKVETIDKTPKR